MKTALFGQRIGNKAEKTETQTISEKIERLLLRTVLTVFMLLVAVQIALLNPSVRNATANDPIEGELLGTEVFLYVPCKMELKLMNIDNCPDLKVLVNGAERDAFEDNSVLLDLKDGDVVELDASTVLVVARVQVSAVSENIADILGKTISVTDGISLVAKIHPFGSISF